MRDLANGSIRGFSVDDGVRHYKPAPQVYRAVQESLARRPLGYG